MTSLQVRREGTVLREGLDSPCGCRGNLPIGGSNKVVKSRDLDGIRDECGTSSHTDASPGDVAQGGGALTDQCGGDRAVVSPGGKSMASTRVRLLSGTALAGSVSSCHGTEDAKMAIEVLGRSFNGWTHSADAGSIRLVLALVLRNFSYILRHLQCLTVRFSYVA